MLTTPVVQGSVFRSFFRAEWCRLKVRNGSFAPTEPVLHVTHPPHILHRVDDDEADSDSDADSVYTTLQGGPVTEERMMDDSLGKRKRRLIPTVVVRVTRRSQEGSMGDVAHDSDNEGDFVDAIDALQDQENETGLDSTLAPGLNLDTDMDLDLGEAIDLEDPIQDGQAFAPALGPRPEDILFDLSDESSNEAGNDGGLSGTQTPGSEAETWAELEDVEMNQTFIPAGMLGEYEMSDDDEFDPALPEQEQEVDRDERLPEGVIDFGFTEADTEAIREALLLAEAEGANGLAGERKAIDTEEETAFNGGDVSNEVYADLADEYMDGDGGVEDDARDNLGDVDLAPSVVLSTAEEYAEPESSDSAKEVVETEDFAPSTSIIETGADGISGGSVVEEETVTIRLLVDSAEVTDQSLADLRETVVEILEAEAAHTDADDAGAERPDTKAHEVTETTIEVSVREGTTEDDVSPS